MLAHRGPPGHPERPERVSELVATLESTGLADRCVKLPPRSATDAELLACHSPSHLERVAAMSAELQREAEARGTESAYSDENYDSVYHSSGTERAARLAAGCVLQAVSAVLAGDTLRALAAVRPPGHHAVCERAMGFCIFNNAAVAARAALATPGVSRVAVVDWDIHHGNGVQDLLYDEPRALFLSLHRYGRGFYPGTGSYSEAGRGAGLGRNVNIPWREGDLTDADYQAAFLLLVEPVLTEFAPDLVIVCAGFDASVDDPIGDCDLTPAGYAWMTERLLRFAGGRVVLALEGGYNTRVTADCAAACVRVLLEGRAAEAPQRQRLSPSVEPDLKRVYAFQRRFWRLWGPGGPGGAQAPDGKAEAEAESAAAAAAAAAEAAAEATAITAAREGVPYVKPVHHHPQPPELEEWEWEAAWQAVSSQLEADLPKTEGPSPAPLAPAPAAAADSTAAALDRLWEAAVARAAAVDAASAASATTAAARAAAAEFAAAAAVAAVAAPAAAAATQAAAAAEPGVAVDLTPVPGSDRVAIRIRIRDAGAGAEGAEGGAGDAAAAEVAALAERLAAAASLAGGAAAEEKAKG
ncbi:hypothetical protein HYH03_004597 [Edaphochlamys debaryana]|uniref:histone deacetylase n=1 Tax=Edaphochlamys debaryana TaxID=47281 RepID=A0A836C336_9CHLO|nr:hypothetical protein HYH03_004597 [Edaphochlamys debaryana]|eukprot:KAG2497442.1 hypothetical protein HYH03_004597 [Edaphochlamys debaryana]